MNRRAAALALASAALLLAACAGVPRTITLSEAELQAQLDRHFPLQRNVFDTIELQLSDPVLRLDAQADRLATELTLQGSERRSGRSLQARLALDYGLRWEPADGSVRLVQPRVRSLQFTDAAPGAVRRAEWLQRMASALAERWLDDLVLYRVSEARLQALHAAGYRPGSLRVTPAGLEIGIEPLP